MSVAELIHQAGISEHPVPLEKAVRGARDRRSPVQAVAGENGRLKRLTAELTLDKTMLQGLLSKTL